MTKSDLRKTYLKKRDEIDIEDRKAWSFQILEQLAKHKAFQEAQVVFTYVSFRSEVDTLLIIEQLLKERKRVFVPVVNTAQRNMHAAEIFSMKDLKSGYKGILEPSFDSPKAKVSEIDLCIVPGAIFDRRGYRIGYGGGYYDRFLPALNESAYRLGLAFEAQMVDELPHENYDVKVHETLTELT